MRFGVAVLFALIAGVGVSSQWNDWILFTHRVELRHQTDATFHTDIGFYVFQLPFLTFVVELAVRRRWSIVLIVTAVAHYLNGGIRVQGRAVRAGHARR